MRLIDQYRYKRLFYFVRLMRLVLVSFLIGFLLQRYFTMSIGIVFTLIVIALLVIFSKPIQTLYIRLENRFVRNLNERETATAKLNRTALAPWDAHIATVVVPSLAPVIGKTLLELHWRETIGINVVMIKRGDLHIAAPGKNQMIFPNDELIVLGTDIQIQKLKVLLRPEEDGIQYDTGEVELYKYNVDEVNPFVGKNIRETGLREQADALVVGIERGNNRILNPESHTVLLPGDTLFIVANKKKVKDFLMQFLPLQVNSSLNQHQ